MALPPIPETISDEIFAVLTRSENAAFIEQQAAKYHLDEGEIALLSAIIGRAMMESLPLGALADALEEEIGFEKDEARELALAIMLELLYPFWPLFPKIDDIIRELGGVVPKEKSAMPVLQGRHGEKVGPIAYPTATPQAKAEPELFGGEIPVPPPPPPPAPRQPQAGGRVSGFGFQVTGERDVPWRPTTKNVARPGDVTRLLDANIIKKPTDTEAKVKGNTVDLSS